MKQMKNRMVLVLDFGGQYNQLIARRIRECGVYSEVKSYQTGMDELRALNPAGIVLAGGPNRVCPETPPQVNPEIFKLGIPILGICCGAQIVANECAEQRSAVKVGEYGKIEIDFDTDSVLFKGLPKAGAAWMSHNDHISKLPEGFKCIAHGKTCPCAAMENKEAKIYAVQFHPEVNHTENGLKMLHNFLYEICGCTGGWSMRDYCEKSVAGLRGKIGDGRVLLALSGGVDSSVCAALLSRAVGRQLTCVYVDHGFMRKNETEEIKEAFKDFDINLITVDASERFIKKLAGVTDPETKRKTIGEEFIRVFEEEAKKIGKVDFLAQGTIYPDVIESGLGNAAVIKSHHNVGGLPDLVDFKEIVEPLRQLFKDEVRRLGRVLGLPDALVNRQPFPGPGLAIRIIGEVTREKLAILKDADKVFRDEIVLAGLDGSINQYFAVLTGIRSVGVMGDGRTYDYTLVLRAVTTGDFMTADFARIPYDVLQSAALKIVNQVKRINRICYDITTKPPATIEWE